MREQGAGARMGRNAPENRNARENRKDVVDLSWLALIAPIVALPAVAGAARLEEIATRPRREDVRRS